MGVMRIIKKFFCIENEASEMAVAFTSKETIIENGSNKIIEFDGVDDIDHSFQLQDSIVLSQIQLEPTIKFSDHLKGLSVEDMHKMSEEEIEINENRICNIVKYNALPPQTLFRPTLFLDLDNTLVCTFTKFPEEFHAHEILLRICGIEQTVWVVERPGLQEFLDALHQKYEMVLFTAGIRQYGIKVLKAIDPKKHIKYLLDRRFCSVIGKNLKGQDIFCKDLKKTGRDIINSVLVDDRDYSFIKDEQNGIKISSFNGENNDIQLHKLKDLLLNYDFSGISQHNYKMEVSYL